MTVKEYDNIPSHIKDILLDYDDSGDLYGEAERIRSKLNKVGWDCDYDLSGTIFDVRLTSLEENIMERAADYAGYNVVIKWEGRSKPLFVEQDNGDLRYNEEAQDIFNEFYDYHLTRLRNKV